MPRRPRIQDAGYVHHVICRGNDRQPIFKSSQDYQKYLEIVNLTFKLYPLKIYNYVLMDNHLHLLVEPVNEGNLSKAMEYLSKAYAKYFNKTYDHVGHVFQARFKSFLIQTERYFFTCLRYIDLNPVKAGMVTDPKNYKWGGYKTLGLGQISGVDLTQHELYQNLGTTPEERQIAYRAIVLNSQMEEIDLLNKRAGVLGDKEFKEKFSPL